MGPTLMATRANQQPISGLYLDDDPSGSLLKDGDPSTLTARSQSIRVFILTVTQASQTAYTGLHSDGY